MPDARIKDVSSAEFYVSNNNENFDTATGVSDTQPIPTKPGSVSNMYRIWERIPSRNILVQNTSALSV
jgi:hypothetical protein